LNSREQVLAGVARRLADFNELEGLLGEGREVKAIAIPSLKGVARAIDAARALRKKFGLEDDEPIRNICGLLEDRGYKVLLVSIASDAFFGLSVAKQDGGPAVVINDWERISVERRIFTAAHELGHLVLHLSAFDVNEVAETKAEEKEANVFAAHFLMPDRLFRSEWDETYGLPFVKRVLKVKRMFRVSYRTVLQRLMDTHPGGTNYFARFNVEYKRMFGTSLRKTDEPEGMAEDEFHAPEPLRAGEPDNLSPSDFEEDRLSALVRRGVEQELITLSRAGEILGKTLEEMRELSASWVQ
jgi:Zn-dependent peptidase ImmA (M78 family)